MTRRNPVEMMLGIAAKFLASADEIDGKVQAAVAQNASQVDILALKNLAATDRLRALSACQAAAPYCSPRLQAVEISPISQTTAARFEARIAEMSEDEVLEHIRRISDGSLTIEMIDAQTVES